MTYPSQHVFAQPSVVSLAHWGSSCRFHDKEVPICWRMPRLPVPELVEC